MNRITRKANFQENKTKSQGRKNRSTTKQGWLLNDELFMNCPNQNSGSSKIFNSNHLFLPLLLINTTIIKMKSISQIETIYI